MQESSDYILSVVIVNWNAGQLSIDCIDSIYRDKLWDKDPHSIEIILVDNGSSDGSVFEISERFPGVRIVSNDKNLGYAVACNQGMRIARGKYVLLLGNDTVLKDNALENCVNFLDNDISCGAVGCRLIYPDGELQGNCKRFPRLRNAFYTYLSLNRLNYDYDMLWFDYGRTTEVEQIATTFLMIRNDILKKVGFFDEQYKILYNDVDLCKKIWGAGYKIFFLHTAEAIHYGCHSTKRAGFKVRRIMYGDIYRYYRNSFGIRAILLKPILLFRLAFIIIIKNKFVF